MTHPENALADLRARRRRLSEDVARLSWLRRLVTARSDLEVARLTGVIAEPHDLEPIVLEALALGAPAGPELLHALSRSARSLEAAARDVQSELDHLTTELVERLADDPALCLVG